MFGRKKSTSTKAEVTQADIDGCIARAIAEGDMVNLNFCFSPNSPLRQESPENLQSDKYTYLRPTGERSALYDEALQLASRPDIQAHHKEQLSTKRPAQLHAEVVLALADNAVRLEKYTVAGQAYERLRIRERMRGLFTKEGIAAVDAGDMPRAARAFRVASGLSYDYAAFPEPLPLAPNYQSRALMLHAIYPRNPLDSVAMLPPDRQLQVALEYLLLDPALAAPLLEKPLETQADFLAEYVRQRDPRWDVFAQRYREAVDMVNAVAERMKQVEQQQGANSQLAAEIAAQEAGIKPEEVPAKLLGRNIEKGEWWQYLKDLAYQHPAAVLFVARQIVAKDTEILLPRYVRDAPLGKKLGLYN
jgi:hypothetical protein